MAKPKSGSWEDIWMLKGVEVEWRDEIRQYCGVCRHPTCAGLVKSVIFGLEVQEMDKAVRKHCKSHPRRDHV